MQNGEAYWALFYETGAPAFYLSYRMGGAPLPQ